MAFQATFAPRLDHHVSESRDRLHLVGSPNTEEDNTEEDNTEEDNTEEEHPVIPNSRRVRVRTAWFTGATRHSSVTKYVKRLSSKINSYISHAKVTMLTQSRTGEGFPFADPEQERHPPAQPTPVTFPAYNSPEEPRWTPECPPPDLRALFVKVLRPTDITNHHVEALSIQLSGPSKAEALLRCEGNQASFAERHIDAVKELGSYSSALKINSLAIPKYEFDDRIHALLIDNDAAFRSITRSTKDGTESPRLSYMRKFWEALEAMSQYWDASLDHYFEQQLSPAPPMPNARKQNDDAANNTSASSFTNERYKKAKLNRDAGSQVKSADEFEVLMSANATSDLVSGSDVDGVTHGDEIALPPHIPQRVSSLQNVVIECRQQYGTPPPEAHTTNGIGTSTPLLLSPSLSPLPSPQPRHRYKGRRISTGRMMPDQFRIDMVKSFVESIAWAFQCSVTIPRRMPVVHIDGLCQPVRQTAMVFRLPKSRTKGSQGWVEGPVMGIQVRAETDFDNEDGQPIEAKARLDLMRELGGLLQLAQERRREGRTEVKPGKGKWWTTVPRWGGGPGGELENEVRNSDPLSMVDDVVSVGKENERRKKSNGPRKPTGRKTPAVMWKELKCGRGYWDAKTLYEAIGKDKDSDFDEVFMVSSLNHHICLLKLTVHGAYTDYLTSAILPDPIPANASWCQPQLQRSEWFDLFDVEQRVEAFRSLWGVMSYLLRQQGATDALDVPDA